MSEPTGASDALRQFAASTTAHGFGKLNHPLALFRAVWTILILLAAGVFFFNFSLLLISFWNQPVSVSIDPRGAEFAFPDITVCAKNAFAISRSFKLNSTGTPVATNRFGQIMNGISYLETLAKAATDRKFGDKVASAKSLSQTELLHYLFLKRDTAGLMVKDMIGDLSFNSLSLGVENFLLSCRYGEFGCEAYDLVTNAYSGYSNCFTFSLKTFRKRNPTFNIDEISDLNLILFTDYVFPSDTVRDIMKSMKDMTLGMQSSPAVVGFVHQPDTHPTSGTKFEASGLTQTTLSVRHTTYQFANTRRKPCESDDSKVSKYNVYETRKETFIENAEFVSTRKDCVNRVTQKMFLNKCGCINSRIAIPSEMATQPRCGNITHYLSGKASGSNVTLETLYATLKDSYGSNDSVSTIRQIFSNLDCIETTKSNLTNSLFKEKCKEFCTLQKYSVSVASNSWPTIEPEVMQEQLDRWLTSSKHFNRNNAGKIQNDASNLLRQVRADVWTLEQIYRRLGNLSDNAWKNFVAIRVRIDHPSSESEFVEQKIDYTFPDFISGIGGILGLYLGVSLLTLCEIVELLLTIGTLISNRFKRKNGQVVQEMSSTSQKD